MLRLSGFPWWTLSKTLSVDRDVEERVWLACCVFDCQQAKSPAYEARCYCTRRPRWRTVTRAEWLLMLLHAVAMGQLHGIALQCPWPFDMFSSHLHMDVKRVQVTASRPARLSVTWVTRRSILRPSLTSAN